MIFSNFAIENSYNQYPNQVMKPIKILKNRSDIGAGTRGSDMGIDALEVAAINSGSDYFIRFPSLDIETDNESVYNKVNAIFAKRIAFVQEQCERVAEAVKATVQKEHFPIILSGDHSSALGTISGLKAAFPEKRVGVVWIDAHADLHSPFTTPSGNVHGMPLAAALGEDNREYQTNVVTKGTKAIWEQLKNVAVEGQKILPEDLVFFGVRDTELAENHIMDRLGLRNYRVAEFRHRGADTCMKEVKKRLKDCDMIYISFDVDSLDCDLVSRGTGTPVPKGFDPAEVTTIIKSLLDTGKVFCMEVTEVNPLLDTKGNKMAETAFKILDSVTTHYLSTVSAVA